MIACRRRPFRAGMTARRLLWLFRLVMSTAAVLLFDQAVFAGQFLAGSYPALHTHRANATVAGITVLAAALSGLLLWRPGRGPLWPLAGSLVLFALIAAQIAIGFARLLTLHIPLGVAIIGLSIGLAIRAWRLDPAAGPVATHAAGIDPSPARSQDSAGVP
ncbi:hypothetical protein [Actinoplanes sp. NPDC051851]|uniref:hypothetical protein n=1 Tax=Actinoplanes sp. NPDC051851 TaxID=3154753 RepID=UPI0034317FDE